MNLRWDAASADNEPLRETSTHWSIIRQAQLGVSETAQTALHQLVLRYTPPLLHYLQGPPWRFDSHAAHDLIQGFVEVRLLAGRLVAHSDPARGHFRGYLKTALDNFVRDRLRSPGHTPRPLAHGSTSEDGRAEEFASLVTTIDPFDVAWARGMLRSVVSQLQNYCTERGQTAAWTVFEARLLRPILEQAEPLSYEDLADQCGLDSPKAAANALITAKRIFRILFEDAIAAYAPEEGERQEELHLIRSVFASGVTLAETPAVDPKIDESIRLAQMLDLPRGEPLWSPLELEALIEQQLASPAADFVHEDVSPADPGPTLLDTLTTAPASSAAYVQIKNWAKTQATSAVPAVPREVASALYFAALSAARAVSNARITQLSDQVLSVSLTELAEQSWIPAPLRNLYRTARDGLVATVSR
ncbi:MAG: hypothetical protein AABP62_26370 [Planctomycetota bacterium]